MLLFAALLMVCWTRSAALADWAVTDPPPATMPSLAGAPNVDDLVAAVRHSSQWIHQVSSFYVKFDITWHRTNAGIKDEYAQFPRGMKVDAKTDWNLWPTVTETLEIGFDDHRVGSRGGRDGADFHQEFFDGTRGLTHDKYFTQSQEEYFITPYRNSVEPFEEGSWLRDRDPGDPHSFWWMKAVPPRYRSSRPAYHFSIVGRAEYRGIDCWVLNSQDTRTRWYVGVARPLLYGIAEYLSAGHPFVEHYLLDYREVVAGCPFPILQGYVIWESPKAGGKERVTMWCDFDAVDVRINQSLPDDLFHMTIEDGVGVSDTTHEPQLSYKQKRDRTTEEWTQIVAQAEARQKKLEAEAAALLNKQLKPGSDAAILAEARHRWALVEGSYQDPAARQALIDKPAVDFPAKSRWFNTDTPLTLDQLRGKVVLLHFWAEWSEPCQRDLSALADLHTHESENHITVIGVHAPGSTAEAIQSHLKKFGLEYPVIEDIVKPTDGSWQGTLSRAYLLRGLSRVVVIDRTGKIAGIGSFEDMSALATQTAAEPATQP
jgi:thiol-disulfide isomerase/thioredoxin